MTDDDPLRLLLIEDNHGDARYVAELLREATLLVRAAREGRSPTGESRAPEYRSPELMHEDTLEAGLDRLDQEFDAILLDLNLQESRGLETLERVLSQTDLPIVVLTGLQQRETGLAAIRAGADDYLVKAEINSDLLMRSVYHAIERREHERELRLYESLIERSADVNAILDPDGAIRYVTPSVEHVLGYEPDALIGECAFDFTHPDDREMVFTSLSSVIERGELSPIEFRVAHADGSWIVLESRGRNLLDDPLIEGVVVYTRDVTERVQREQKLEQFSQVVSHDLRNPLGIAQMYLEEVRREGELSDLNRIDRALDRMDTLIDTLLTLAREGQTIDEPEGVQLRGIVEDAWAHVDTGDATLDVDGVQQPVIADPERLQTLFENLFRNAVEHGGETVNIRVGRKNGVLAIEDNGPGIAPQVRDEVFTFGYSTGGGGGTGLSIVQAIAEAHGWDIDILAGKEGGARFEIRGVETPANGRE